MYFPGRNECEKFNIEDYGGNYQQMSRAILNSVRTALINRFDSSVYNWPQIIALQARQKMSKWKDISESDRKNLEEYMGSFDEENKNLNEKVRRLDEENRSLRIQLDVLKESISEYKSGTNFFYRMGSEPNLYNGEYNDLVTSILNQVRDRFDKDSRAYLLINAMLKENEEIGECRKILDGIREVFSGDGRLTNASKSKLRSLGFTISESGKHYKIYFHDPRYMFTVSKTPGDYREGKNLIADISRMIDIYKKI